jgi:hypothetical protein
VNSKQQIGSAILWAAAILASAILHAPVTLTLVVLPCLYVTSLLVARRPQRVTRGCKTV